MPDRHSLVHVAVGVIVNDSNEILIAKRGVNQHQGGLWEFPGGKVDLGESVQSALTRELREELAIEVLSSRALLEIRHDYHDKSVLLDVWLVSNFEGLAKGNEGQAIAWVPVENLRDYDFPAANEEIVVAVESSLRPR